MSNLLFITFLIILVLLVLAPRWGLLARWRLWRLANEREHIQDALKLLLDEHWQLHQVGLSDLSARYTFRIKPVCAWWTGCRLKV